MDIYNFSYTGNIQEFTVPKNGRYKLECWGASGANKYNREKGKGGYASGTLDLTFGTKLYIVVGGEGSTGGYNGGGQGDLTVTNNGGGASDIRLKKLTNTEGLLSRIIVAGGGGAASPSKPDIMYAEREYEKGGCGGGESGTTTRPTRVTAAGQTGGGTWSSAYTTNTNLFGVFGKGGFATTSNCSGGGGGWYGGAGAPADNGGTGGSGYVYHQNSYKPSNYFPSEDFTMLSVVLIDGENSLPNHAANNTIVGNKGHGHIRITLLQQYNTPPTISGSDKDLGKKNTAFSITYEVDDKDGNDELRVTESLNGSVINTIVNPQRKKTYTINISDSLLANLTNDIVNTIEVKVTDGQATVYRRWTFVKTNTPPVITVTSGQNANLGDLEEKPSAITYTVADGESDICTVIEKINNEIIRSFTANLGQINSFTIEDNKWIELPKGSNILKIEVTDSKGNKAVKSYTFNKVGDKVEVMLKNPIQTSIAATKILITPKWNIAGGTGEVWVCNNGLDANPTWENATSTINLNRPFIFANKTKTHANWGINVKIKLSKNVGYDGEISLTGFGGAYE